MRSTSACWSAAARSGRTGGRRDRRSEDQHQHVGHAARRPEDRRADHGHDAVITGAAPATGSRNPRNDAARRPFGHVDENLRRLVDAGFALELDDFGTGHAAIANLRKYPLERIKIDRSLVAGIDLDVDLVMITSAITNLARSLGLKVLAEGVETAGELEVLRQIGTCVHDACRAYVSARK
jgi:hypothetical protein